VSVPRSAIVEGMRVALWSLVLASAACVSPVPGPPGPPGPRQLHITLAPKVYHLANGLTAILIPDPAADLVSLHAEQRVGPQDDPPDHPGLSHLAAHLSYATLTGKLTRWDQLDRIGTNIDMAMTTGETAFVVKFDAARLADVLGIEAERLARHCDAGTPHWLSWERGHVANEVRAASSWIVNRDFRHVAYAADDARHRAYDATPESIAAVSQDDVCGFLDRYYVPANSTIVVSGPIDPATFEHAVKAVLEPVPGGSTNPRPRTMATPASGTDATVTADVSEPALAISYALPDDRGQRTVMTFALELLATKIDAGILVFEDDLATLWITDHVLDAATALTKINAALQTGLVDPTEFEATRTRRVTELLGRLDSLSSRLGIVADSVDLDAPFTALDQVSPQGFDKFVAAKLDLQHARIFRMQPSGTRPKWRPVAIGNPGHMMIGPSSFIADPAGTFVPSTSRVLAHARTIKLANGMTVILMPTSPIPILDLRLGFSVGTAAEPEDHRGTAALAVSAIDEMAARTHADTRWAVGTHLSGASLDGCGVALRGPALDADLLIGQFDGLAHDQFQSADIDKGHDNLIKLAHSPMQHLWEQGNTMRVTLYGANHPYGRAKPPGQPDVMAFDEKEVAAFYAKYLQPNNATLVVTGGFDPEAIEPLVHQTFDAWKGKGDSVPIQPARVTAAAYAVDEPRATVLFRVTWQGALMDDHYEVRLLLANMLGAPAAKATARYVQFRQAGTYELNGSFDPTTAPSEIADALASVAGIEAGRPVYKAAFDSARTRQARYLGGAMSSAPAWAGWIIFGLDNGRDPQWLAGMAKRAAAVSYDDVVALARSELTLDRANIIISGPHDAVAATYAALGITPTWLPH
jgi:zinc protease